MGTPHEKRVVIKLQEREEYSELQREIKIYKRLQDRKHQICIQIYKENNRVRKPIYLHRLRKLSQISYNECDKLWNVQF